MYKFEYINYIWWLLALLVPIGLFLLYFQKRRKFIKNSFSEKNIANTIPDFSMYKPLTKFIIVIFAAALIIIAIANPLAGKKVNKNVQSKGSDVQFVVDISNSMLCEDIKPNRLSKVKQIMLSMLDKFGSDRAGLVVFAGDAFIQLPITIDQMAVGMFVRNLSTDLISRQGTNVANALETALVSIDSSKAKYPAIVLISDGESFEDNPENIVSELQRRKIPVHTIAVGSQNGAPVPVYNASVRVGFKKDENGNAVISKPNEELLKSISVATKGVFVGTSDLASAAEIIMKELAKSEKEENRELVFNDYNTLYLWALIPALILLIIDFFLMEKRLKWQDIFRNFIERRRI